MKSILISIKPKHCYNILNKDKILEIRTTCPADWKKYLDGKTKIKPEPCKVCIYCTQGRILHDMNKESYWNGKRFFLGDAKSNNVVASTTPFVNGKVVSQFTLKQIEKFTPYWEEYDYWLDADELKETCLTREQIWNYGKGKNIYAWHIDDLIIYDKPKELSDFKKENKCHYANYEKGCCFENCTFFDLKDCDGKYSKIYKAPQSWCYVKGE